MVAIAAGLQSRILDSASRHLGAGAKDFLRELCATRMDTAIDRLEYRQLGALIKLIEAEAVPLLGEKAAAGMASELADLQGDVEAGIPGRVVGSVARVLGPAAEPFMQTVCQRLSVELEQIDRATLPIVAEAAAAEALSLLGRETADALEQAILKPTNIKPPSMIAGITAIAQQHAGPSGEQILRRLCRDKLETELDEIDPRGLAPLAEAVRAEAGKLIGEAAAAAFASDVARAVVSPNDSLRRQLLDLARRFIGPAGEDFMRRACKREGMPWDAIDYEHMMWLAEVVRAEAAPIIGKKSADEFARGVRQLLVGLK